MVDFTSAVPTFVITLREGVEAGLVVGIVLAYLQKANQARLNAWVYGGVTSGLVASGLVGVLFVGLIQSAGMANQAYTPVMKPLLNGIFSVVAIVLLSWMLLWMTQQAKLLKAQVEGAVSQTLSSSGAGWGIFGLVFFAVLREGFETVLFISAQLQAGWIPVAGAIAGILAATTLTVLLFKWGVKINLRQFFQVMGVFLLLIVAGLVVSALAHIDIALDRWAQVDAAANFCLTQASCILGAQVWDTRQVLPEKQFPGILLHTLFGYEDQLYLVQAVSYVGFWLTIGTTYLRSFTGWNQPKPSAAMSPQK
jgi:high-affinity iron transporter